MKSKYCRYAGRLCAIMFFLCGCVRNRLDPVCAETVTVDPAVRYQIWDGWGTSLSWWATVIGGWSDKNRNAVADLFFDPEEGLGLNIVRYNIGGQDDPSHNHMRVGGDVEGYWPAEGEPYDWTADENQRWVLKAAIERGATITEAAAFSPPYWMTVSGCSAGAEDASHNNLQEQHYETFAEYLTEVVRHFRDEWGVTFTTLEPINEPFTAYWKAGGANQGCHYDRDKQNRLLRILAAKLQEKGLTTELSGPDETSVELTIGTFLAYDEDVKKLVSQINTHTYGGSVESRAELRRIATEHGKRLYMSEMCFNSPDTGEQGGFKGALDIAAAITLDLRVMQPEGWVLWQASINDYWYENHKIEYGLIHADYEGGTETWDIRKKYFGYAHYTKFIRPGYQMVGINADDAVSFVDRDAGKLVIVVYNSGDEPRTREYSLDGFSTVGAEVEVHRTTKTSNLEKLGSLGIEDKNFVVTEPGPSVSTYVISDVS